MTTDSVLFRAVMVCSWNPRIRDVLRPGSAQCWHVGTSTQPVWDGRVYCHILIFHKIEGSTLPFQTEGGGSYPHKVPPERKLTGFVCFRTRDLSEQIANKLEEFWCTNKLLFLEGFEQNLMSFVEHCSENWVFLVVFESKDTTIPLSGIKNHLKFYFSRLNIAKNEELSKSTYS